VNDFEIRKNLSPSSPTFVGGFVCGMMGRFGGEN